MNQDFVGGEGDHAAYIPGGFDGFELVTGELVFALPPANHAAYDTGSYTDTSIPEPLTLTFGGTTFNFGGPLDLAISVENEHISITAWGDDAHAVINFFGDDDSPEFDANPISNLFYLSQWGGYIDFFHANGSYLYTDWGSNVSDATIIDIPDAGSTILLLFVGLGGLGILARLRGTA